MKKTPERFDRVQVIILLDGEEFLNEEFEGFDIARERGFVEDWLGFERTLSSNGHWRTQIKCWNGFAEWDDFQAITPGGKTLINVEQE